ncbi:MAG: hypothetical protein BWK76_22260 [Desulfobulbaceae bacterium A2]|nr:MAG: hypothetical protein BWK76_22260 [Desulfobulbaceae bacterium A2]
MRALLVITANKADQELIKTSLRGKYIVEARSTKEAGLKILQQQTFDLSFIDIDLLAPPAHTDIGLKAAMQPFWLISPSLNIIVMVPPPLIQLAVTAVKNGASNYLSYPLHGDELQYVVESIGAEVISLSELAYLREQFWRRGTTSTLATKNPVMEGVYEKVRSVAPIQSTVLLIGETGTGKGMLARLIHAESGRKNNQFISVHCGAIPDTLLESELFGHERGAFTGATRRKLGKFELANNGTLFLDEIGTISPAAQIKLLQVLQEKRFSRVGSEESIAANARIITAANADLEAMCAEGSFRRDLYYRLNVFPIHIPPLRERTEDIPLLVELFLAELNREHQKNIQGIHPEVLDALASYPWPGNIRELKNLVERAYILEHGAELTAASFPAELFRPDGSRSSIRPRPGVTLAHARDRAIQAVEREYLTQVLAMHHGRIDLSAAHAGITTRQLHKLMKKYALHKEAFKVNADRSPCKNRTKSSF